MFKKQKKEKSTIKKFFPSLPVEVLALQEIFEKMSERGYLVIGNSNSFYEFEECEPKKRKFHVEYFIKASVFDSRPEKKTIEFIDFCEVAGWNYCFSNGKMQCFYTEDVDSPDIETDDQLRFQSIIKADIYSQITVWLLSVLYLLVGIKEGISTFQHYHPFSEFTTSSIQFGLVSFFLVYIVMSLTSFIDFMVFYMRNNKNVSIGEPLKLYSPKKQRLV